MYYGSTRVCVGFDHAITLAGYCSFLPTGAPATRATGAAGRGASRNEGNVAWICVVCVSPRPRYNACVLYPCLQVARRRVRLARQDEVVRATGFVVGTVPPFGAWVSMSGRW